MVPLAIGAGLGALGGFIGGASDDVSTSKLNLDPAQQWEKDLYGFQNFDFNQLRNLIGAGPGQSDIEAALAFNRQIGKEGFIPTSGDISRANQYTGDIFAAEREALSQGFQDQIQESMRQRALMGRGGADPILQAKLAQEQTRQERMLGSQERGFAAQFAQGLVGQRGNALNALAQQAQSNRLALLQTGQSLLGGERQFRLNTAEQRNVSEGSFAKGLAGAIGGAGSGLSAAANIKGMLSYSGYMDQLKKSVAEGDANVIAGAAGPPQSASAPAFTTRGGNYAAPIGPPAPPARMFTGFNPPIGATPIGMGYSSPMYPTPQLSTLGQTAGPLAPRYMQPYQRIDFGGPGRQLAAL